MWKEKYTDWIWRNPIFSALVLLAAVLIGADSICQAIAEKHLIAVLRDSPMTLTQSLWLFPGLIGTLFAIVLAMTLARGVTHYKKRSSDLAADLVRAQESVDHLRMRITQGEFLIRTYSPESHALGVGLITLKTKDEVAAGGMGRMISPKQLAEEHREMAVRDKVGLEEAERERERLRGLLGNEQEALRQCRSDLACTRLQILGAKVPGKNVTVRYIDFSDNQFAEHLAWLIRRHAGWVTTPVRDANSHLIRETEQRIVFSSGDVEVVKQLGELFNHGNLAGEPVSPQEIIDRPSDDPNITLTIFPKVKG